MKLSIITICRNDAPGLVRTLRSTFEAQPGFDDWEQIVVDGASTDGSFAEVDRYRGDPRLGWCISESDTGVYNAMNKGAAHARGDYLLFLNSGDTLLPDVLERVFAEDLRGDIVYGDLIMVRSDREETKVFPSAESIRPWFFLTSSLPHPASFISSGLFRLIGGYDESYRIASDALFFLEAVANRGAKLFHLGFPVSRFIADGLSSRPELRRDHVRERVRFLTPFFGRNVAVRVSTVPDPDVFLDENTRLELQGDVAFRPFLGKVARAARSFYLEKPAVSAAGKNDAGPDDWRLAVEFLDAAAALRGHPRIALFVRHSLHWLAARLRRSASRCTDDRFTKNHP